jgi:hypothetical protein
MAVTKPVVVVAEEPEDLKVECKRGGVRAARREASRGNSVGESSTTKRDR